MVAGRSLASRTWYSGFIVDNMVPIMIDFDVESLLSFIVVSKAVLITTRAETPVSTSDRDGLRKHYGELVSVLTRRAVTMVGWSSQRNQTIDLAIMLNVIDGSSKGKGAAWLQYRQTEILLGKWENEPTATQVVIRTQVKPTAAYDF